MEIDVLTRLTESIAAAGSQAAWARATGIAPAYLCQVLAGRRPPGPSVLAALGLQRRIVIEPARQDRACDRS